MGSCPNCHCDLMNDDKNEEKINESFKFKSFKSLKSNKGDSRSLKIVGLESSGGKYSKKSSVSNSNLNN